jgi:excinuclease ABC subunit C
VGYVDKEGYRKAIDGVIAFLSGRYKEIEWALNEEMRLASQEQRFEDAARERNRLRAVRSLLERQRVAHDGDGSMDAIAVAVAETEANAQVFQIRDGVLSDRQSFYLDNTVDAELGDVVEAFILQYYASAMSVPPLVIVQRELGPMAALAAAHPGAGRAQRPARHRPGEAALRAPAPAAGGGAGRPPAGARPGHHPAAD